MDFFHTATLKTRKSAGMLVLPFWKGKKAAEAAADLSSFEGVLKAPLASHDFCGKEGELMVVYVSGAPEKRVALLGLGAKEGISAERLRRAYAQVTKASQKMKLKDLNVITPDCGPLSKKEVVQGVAEGLLLLNYVFEALKRDAIKDGKAVLLDKVTFVGVGKQEVPLAERCVVICDAVNMARDLVNGNADDVTPQHLAAVAAGLAKMHKHVKTTIFDKKRIEKEKMGLLLAVNRSSEKEPVFIIVEYKGDPKSADTTVLVGKGITFDTGGLNLKPTGSMETMKCDMAGAATVLSVVQAAASLELKVNVTAVVASTENSIGSKSYKPGDVYEGYAGKSVEIGNTDAEGRLVLADALAYAVVHLKPKRLIDLATLTGAVEIALGNEVTGLFSNDDILADQLTSAGSATGERLWRLPLYEEYRDQLRSDVADIKSTGGRPAGSITAAMFLKEFVNKIPWAHLDIAGTAFLSDGKRYSPKHATGIGVRLLISFLESLHSYK
jgi:leucyl aminopeptidase